MLKKLSILCVALCVSTAAYAQKKNLVKGLMDAATSKTPSAVSAQVERQVARATLGAQLERQLASQITQYHPVFGYTLPTEPILSHNLDLHTPFLNASVDDLSLMQVKPILNQNHIQAAFKMYEKLDIPQTTQMIYLWSLAHPQEDVLTAAYSHIGSFAYRLQTMAVDKLREEYKTSEPYNKLENLPNLLFLKRLTQTHSRAHSYVELYESIDHYPKHIRLNDYGFPNYFKDTAFAEELDLYLMLSNPKEMAQYNNAGKYTPFVLTKEEREAANKLLALRLEGEKLPANPTPRDLLTLAYNRLATHTVPYTTSFFRVNLDSDYKAYPNYKNTQLYRAIKGMLEDVDLTTDFPDEHFDEYEMEMEDLDILHLFVLDAIMGGVEPDNLKGVDRVFTAFDKMIYRVPCDGQVDRHLEILRDNLRFIFDDLFYFNFEDKCDLTDSGNPQWYKSMVADKVYRLLNPDIRQYHYNKRSH